ncbi:FMN-binding protein [Sulfobacillus harzensis]|uniref:FMN-binding protein n=1 Tax=Sulfobacillus harzensis TaxID=2729629 RepID=A0A7Y0L7R1_9FIRM|nr:FMN-binding protein [Sulfobacillus harzensis]NMP24863.1 FMN-binding protein [Sulfobacillus harzensis]
MASPTTKLWILCSAAVGAIYAAGHLVTVPTASIAEGPSAVQSASSSASRSNSLPARTSASQSAYRDGHYSGSGSNPYGILSVLVTVSGGKIASVRITNYAMHYPQSYIDPTMPEEVVSQQTWNVYGVSGATASSENFAEAVYNALQKAKA